MCAYAMTPNEFTEKTFFSQKTTPNVRYIRFANVMLCNGVV